MKFAVPVQQSRVSPGRWIALATCEDGTAGSLAIFSLDFRAKWVHFALGTTSGSWSGSLIIHKTLPDAQPIARIQSGDFNWRGGEGSVTDRISKDHRRWANPQKVDDQAWSGPSTGLIYMQARYYEPATGRFTQSDPLPYQFNDFMTGQNNRWVYCASDPVNASDSNGRFAWAAVLGIIAIAAALLAFATWLIDIYLEGLKRDAQKCGNTSLASDIEDLQNWIGKLQTGYQMVAAIAGLIGAAGILGAQGIAKAFGEFSMPGFSFAEAVGLSAIFTFLIGGPAYTMADAVYNWVYNYSN